MIKIILNIKNEDVELTIEEARKLYNELSLLFNNQPSIVPAIFPPTYGQINCNCGGATDTSKNFGPITASYVSGVALKDIQSSCADTSKEPPMWPLVPDRTGLKKGEPSWVTFDTDIPVTTITDFGRF